MRIAALLIAALVAAPAWAQGGNPADLAREGDKKKEEQQPSEGRQPSYEMPAVTVFGVPQGELREEDRIGTYGQPRWTARRRFGETRVYVIPEGDIELEWWTKPEVPRHGGTETEFMQEAEIGLPGRFQLDLYTVEKKEATGAKGDLSFDAFKTEVRWALADWDKIPLNPTLYVEYLAKNDPDRVEAKLLLGTEIGSRWHYGANLVWDHAVSGPLDTSYELNQGISYTVVDEKFSIGLETNFEWHDDKDHRFDIIEQDYLVGPSMRVCPLKQLHIDFAPLFGVTEESPLAKIYFIVGWEF